MSGKEPDFYLASTEGYELESPRRCHVIRVLGGERRNDYLLVRLSPPIPGQKFGLGGRDIDQVVVATRFRGDKLPPTLRWPVYVHVARLLAELPEEVGEVRDDQLEEIAWAELYPTEEAARKKLA